jgi:kinesin family protein 5
LGGNYKTYLIVTCSPHSYNLDEIISSLLFAKRVKCVKNKYKINIKYSYEELQNLVDKLNEKLLLANEKIHKLLKGEKINLEEENKKDNYEKENSSFICNKCDLFSKKKKFWKIKFKN